MSNEAITWAFSQDIKPSSMKFVLVALGNHAQDDALAWPSIAALCQKTGQDRKTVIAALDRLEAAGYLTNTGKCKGETGQIKVYKLNLNRHKSTENGTVDPDVSGKEDATQKAAGQLNGTENGTVKPNETVPFFPPNSPVFPSNSTVFPHNSTENGTRNPQNPHEPTGNPHKRGKAAVDDFDPMNYLLANGVEGQVAKDWLKLRKAKRAEATKTAIDGQIREAGKAGLRLQAALAVCCERGWQGFKAEWVMSQQPRASPIKPSRHVGFEKIDYSERVTEDERIG